MIRSHMMWRRTLRSLSARIARMAAVAGTCAMVLFGLGIGAAAGAEKAPSSGYSEYQIKAAFLYNFAKFTKWPSGTYADASAPLVICVLGKDAFGKALDALAGKRINGRPVAVSRLAGVEEAGRCQVVFISESEEERVPGIVGYLAGRPVLTVCNAPSCTRFRGIIHLNRDFPDRSQFHTPWAPILV